MTLTLTIMILVSLELLYLSTNALLIRKIKDQAKPHQIRSDLINQIFVLEKRNLILINYFDEANFSIPVIHLIFIYLFIIIFF